MPPFCDKCNKPYYDCKCALRRQVEHVALKVIAAKAHLQSFEKELVAAKEQLHAA